MLAKAKFPVILSGGGVIMANGIKECAALAEYLTAPVVNSYLHNDSFPAQPCAVLRAARLPGLEGGDEADRAAPTWCWRWARAWDRSARCRSTGSITGRRTPKSSRSTADPRMLGLVKKVIDRHLRRRAAGRGCIAGPPQGAGQNGAEQGAPRRNPERERSVGRRTRQLAFAQRQEAASVRARRWRRWPSAMPKNAMVSTDIGNVCSVVEQLSAFRSGAFVPCRDELRQLRLRLSRRRSAPRSAVPTVPRSPMSATARGA